MEQVLSTANGTALWLFAIFIISIVVIQALTYLRMTLLFSDKFLILSQHERRVIYKTAVINSIGPAVAIFFVAVSLIAMVGGPVTLMRVGVIGSAIFEFISADLGAKAVNAEIGTDSYTLQAFTSSVWAMTLGGMGWLISTFFLTKNLDRAQEKIGVGNPELIRAIGSAAPIAIFFMLATGAAIDKNWLSDITIVKDNLAALLASAVSMTGLHFLAKRWSWLREWSMGLSLIIGLIAGHLVGQTLTGL